MAVSQPDGPLALAFADRMGFMQGRLSPIIDGRIQCFPRTHWREEFRLAGSAGWRLIEWTLDDEGLWENPYMTESGRAEVAALAEGTGIAVGSLTADCFMQAPFFKARGAERDRRLKALKGVLDASMAMQVSIVVLPIVDEGALTSEPELEELVQVLREHTDALVAGSVVVAFESDLPPRRLADLIGRFDPRAFGVNYDTGNSASLGYDAGEEFDAFGSRIVNVHLKDRALGGPTVPLGEGDVDFEHLFRLLLGELGYQGNLILQAARASDGDHGAALARYRAQVEAWIEGAWA